MTSSWKVCFDAEPDPEQAARTLVDTALNQGSRDNITVLVIRCAQHD